MLTSDGFAVLFPEFFAGESDSTEEEHSMEEEHLWQVLCIRLYG